MLCGACPDNITSRLDYYSVLHVGLLLKTAWKMQLVQNAAARVLTGVDWRDGITSALDNLYWLSIYFCV